MSKIAPEQALQHTQQQHKKGIEMMKRAIRFFPVMAAIMMLSVTVLELNAEARPVGNNFWQLSAISQK